MDRYTGPGMTTANPAPGTWSANPNPSSIGLYKEGEGYPRFDAAKARTYFSRVNEKVTRLIRETIEKWDGFRFAGTIPASSRPLVRGEARRGTSRSPKPLSRSPRSSAGDLAVSRAPWAGL